jgi:hypothetical protein
LDDGVDALEASVGEAMAQVGQQIRQVTLDQLGDSGQGLEPTMRRAPEPASEEGAGRAGVAVRPESAEALLESPRPPDLEVLPLQGAERGALGRRHLFGPPTPTGTWTREPIIAVPAQGPVLPAAHLVDGVVQMFDDMELVEHDLSLGSWQVRARRLHVGLPHVRGDGG